MGVRHSASTTLTRPAFTHFLQIWIEPNRQGIAPSYEQKAYPLEEKRGRVRVIVSPDGREGSSGLARGGVLLAGRGEQR